MNTMLLNSIKNLSSSKRFRYSGRDSFKKCILYGTVEDKSLQKNNIIYVHFLFVTKDITCNNVYGSFEIWDDTFANTKIKKPEHLNYNIDELIEIIEDLGNISFKTEF